MKRFLLAVAAALNFSGASAAIVLDFEGINAVYPSNNYANIQNFYNGGTSSQGTSGTNFGIGFSSNALAICLNTPGNSCSNTSRNDPTEKGALFFLSGAQTFMNVPLGFDTGFSMLYVALSIAGSVSVYDGLSGSGNLLATLALPATGGNGCGNLGGFCPFVPIGIGFSGIAKSVSFAGVANQIVFDDITFGSITPGGGNGTVPEPGSLVLIALGLGSLALAARRRKQSK